MLRGGPKILTNTFIARAKIYCSFERIDDIWSCRETLFSSLSKRRRLQTLVKTTLRDARAIECDILLASSKMSRSHGALQHALARATHLTQLCKPCEDAGVNIAAAVQFETAQVLWDQGEMSTSIKILQDLQSDLRPGHESSHMGRPELLARLVGFAAFRRAAFPS